MDLQTPNLPTWIAPVIYSLQGLGLVAFSVLLIRQTNRTLRNGFWKRRVAAAFCSHQKTVNGNPQVRTFASLDVVQAELDRPLKLMEFIAEFYFTALGMVGTITGLSFAFRLAADNLPPQQLQGLIGVAMRTTLVGLLFALVALMSISVYRSKADSFMLDLYYGSSDWELESDRGVQ